MGSPPPPDGGDAASASSPPMVSRSYTPALLDMFNRSNGGGGGTPKTTKNDSSSGETQNTNTTTTTTTTPATSSRPNSDSKPPRHASFNFQIQSKNNNAESPLQPLPLIKDQLQVVEVTRNGRTRKVWFVLFFALSSVFSFTKRSRSRKELKESLARERNTADTTLPSHC